MQAKMLGDGKFHQIIQLSGITPTEERKYEQTHEPTPARCQQSGCTQVRVKPRFLTAEEHIRFLEAVRLYGYGNARQIAAYVQTRNITQVRTHAQKYILKLSRMGSAPAKVCKRMRVVKDSYIKPNPHHCLCLPLSC